LDEVMKQDDALDALDWSSVRNLSQGILRRIKRRLRRWGGQAYRAIANEVWEGGGKTETWQAITRLRKTGRRQLRRDIIDWFLELWRKLFGAAKSGKGKKLYSSTAAMASKDMGEGGFGVQCFVIHNPGSIDDFFEVNQTELGAGGSAKIFTARGRITHEQRAVKRIHKRNPADYQRLMNEVAVMKSLDHPNITRLFETFEDERHLYLVLELCEGGDVLDRLQEIGTFSEFQTAVIARTMLMTLNYLHSNGYVHRDVKPENIMFKDGKKDVVLPNLRLVDFGYSCKVPEEDESMSTKIGSPYYVAPEVLEGSYSVECDLWSIGVVAYLLICGYPPFAGATDAQTLNLIQKGRFIFHKQYWSEVSKPAKHLIKRLLNPDPEYRFRIEQALEHPWIKNRGAIRADRMDDDTVDRLITFHQYHKLRKSAMLAVAYQLEGPVVKPLLDLFLGLDTNGDGLLYKSEFMKAVQALHIEDSFIVQMMQSVDADGSGVIDYSEFIAATLTKDSYINNHAALMRAFRCFDQDDSGGLTQEEVAETLCMGEEEMDEVAEFFKEVDLNDDGVMDYGEFHAMLQREIEPDRDIVEDDMDEDDEDEEEEEEEEDIELNIEEDEEEEEDSESSEEGDEKLSPGSKAKKKAAKKAAKKSAKKDEEEDASGSSEEGDENLSPKSKAKKKAAKKAAKMADAGEEEEGAKSPKAASARSKGSASGKSPKRASKSSKDSLEDDDDDEEEETEKGGRSPKGKQSPTGGGSPKSKGSVAAMPGGSSARSGGGSARAGGKASPRARGKAKAKAKAAARSPLPLPPTPLPPPELACRFGYADIFKE